MAIELQIVVVNLDVNHRTIQRLAAADQTEIAAQLFRLITLMAARFADFALHLLHQHRQGHLIADAENQRQHVDHRAEGRNCRRTHAAHKREANRQTLAVAEACQIGHQQRADDIAFAAVGEWLLLTQRGQLRQRYLTADRAIAGIADVFTGKRQGFRQIRRVTLPVAGGAGKSRRILPLLNLFNHRGERGKRRGRGRFAGAKGGVDRRDALGQRFKAEAIHQQMVIALIPQPAAVADAHQRMTIERFVAVGGQIGSEICLHQFVRLAAGIAALAEIVPFRRDRRLCTKPLRRIALLIQAEARLHGIGFRHCLLNGAVQRRAIDVAVQHAVVRHGKLIALLRNAVSDPDAGLRRDEWIGWRIVV